MGTWKDTNEALAEYKRLHAITGDLKWPVLLYDKFEEE